MIAADFVAFLHVSFIAFVVGGVLWGYRGYRLNRLLFVCGATLLVQMAASRIFNSPCVFTILEANLRYASDALRSNALREDGFVVYYMDRLGLPFTNELTDALHLLFALGAMLRARAQTAEKREIGRER